MMRAKTLFLLPLPILAFVVACSVDQDPTGSSEAADTAQDLTDARQVLSLLGGASGKCKNCHTATPTDVKNWGNAMRTVDAACFAPTTLTAAQRIACLRTDATHFTAHKLGLYAAGATQPQFKSLFDAAYTGTDAATKFNAFKNQAQMPAGGANALTATEFATVKSWVLRGMPQLDAAANGGDAGADSGPSTGDCVDHVSDDLKAHIASMKTTGWGARLADQATPMFGCNGAADALNCLTTQEDLTQTVSAAGVTQKIRKLTQQPSFSSYWTRSSADGRYIGFGGSKVVDLTRPAGSAPIQIQASYDPYFLPSNDGFAWAGASGASGGSIVVCKQSLLADATGTNPSVAMSGPKCTGIASSVYESIGTALDGARYFLIYGNHVNDNAPNQQSNADFGVGSTTTFVPMSNNGTAYAAETPVNLALDHEGDMMLSPSTLLAGTRFANSATAKPGYRVHFVKAVRSGTTTSITAPLAAEVCFPGGKPTFSFDERFLAAHQYVDRNNPEQAGLAANSSNIMFADLKTGQKVRITNMAAGQYAVYPHFRGDGWLHFVVRDTNTHTEYVAATDIAIRMARQ